MIIDASAGEAGELGVLLGELAEHVAHFLLAHGLRHVVFALELHLFGQTCVEVFEASDANLGQHLADVIVGMWKKLIGHSLNSNMYKSKCENACLMRRKASTRQALGDGD